MPKKIGTVSDIGWMILKYLSKRKTPSTTKEIQKHLEVSYSYTLMSLHLLEEWGLVKKTKKPFGFVWIITKKGLSPYF